MEYDILLLEFCSLHKFTAFKIYSVWV